MLTSSPSSSPNAFHTPPAPQLSTQPKAQSRGNGSRSRHHYPRGFNRGSAHSSPVISSSKSPSIRTANAEQQARPSSAHSDADIDVEKGRPRRSSIEPMSSPSDMAKRALPSDPQIESSSAAKEKSSASDTTSQRAETTSGEPGPDIAESSTKKARHDDPAPKVLPTRYEDCNVRDLVIIISRMIMELVRFNDEIPLRDGGLTRFHSRAPPGISVPDYLQRLTTHATLSPPILLSMVYYIDRLCALYPAFTISSLTVHRFLISAATVAAKGLSDSFWTNSLYARVGGVSIKELALLELEFLRRVEWRIVPQPEVLDDYYRNLVARDKDYVLPQVSDSEDTEMQGASSIPERPP